MNRGKLPFLMSGAALLGSLLLPYIFIVFTAPQYPDKSPKMYLHANALKGDLRDWEVVGRYIGIDVEPDLPEFDHNIVVFIVTILASLVWISAFLSTRFKKIASVILLTTAISMAGWAQYRLYQQGHNLDPSAPLRSVVKPFTPPLIGVTRVSKIKIYHLPHVGFLLFGLACGITLYGAWWPKQEDGRRRRH
ncbi:MAG: hypothetical protein ACE5LH_05790 [Fidelibacterota bacterium]